jgi:hypothetical protein
MSQKLKWLIGVIVAGVLVLAIAVPTLAAGPNGTATPTPNATTPPCGNCNGVGYGQGFGGGMDDAVTKLLGMTEEQIQAQRQAGKSLVQIAATKNISEDALINAIVADRKADLDKLVADKKITQAQADQMLTQMKDRIKTMVNRTTVGPPNWAGNGSGVGGMGRMGADGNVATGTGTGLGGMMRFGRTNR